MDIDKLCDLIESFFGYKADVLYKDTEKKEVVCMLYNAFLLKCNLDDRYGRFGAGIVFGSQEATISEFFGKRCSLNTDEKSIKESLQIIDDYCRLRLPDKFLAKYDKSYN